MVYRPPSHAPQGRWARWLHEMRRQRDWSQQRAFEELRVGLRLGPKSRASYVALERGPQAPNVPQQMFLVDYFGQSPEDAAKPEEPDALTAALERQSVAIEALVERLDMLVQVAMQDRRG